MKTSVRSAMLDQARQKMTPEQIAALDKMMQSKMFMSGKRYRVDTAMFSTIVDAGSKQMTMINPTQHTYIVAPIDGSTLQKMMGMPMAAGASPKYNVTDTGKTTTYLGHNCRHYIVDMTMTIPNAGPMTMHGDILAAQDLPGLDDATSEALATQMGLPKTMKGISLLTHMTMNSSATGEMGVDVTANDIKTDPIADSEFEVPAGYQKTDQAHFFGQRQAMQQ
jgi:hypothetical protein